MAIAVLWLWLLYFFSSSSPHAVFDCASGNINKAVRFHHCAAPAAVEQQPEAKPGMMA